MSSQKSVTSVMHLVNHFDRVNRDVTVRTKFYDRIDNQRSMSVMTIETCNYSKSQPLHMEQKFNSPRMCVGVYVCVRYQSMLAHRVRQIHIYTYVQSMHIY